MPVAEHPSLRPCDTISFRSEQRYLAGIWLAAANRLAPTSRWFVILAKRQFHWRKLFKEPMTDGWEATVERNEAMNAAENKLREHS